MSLTPKKDKRRVSKELKDLGVAAKNGLRRLRDDLHWFESTSQHQLTPKEWIVMTNEKLQDLDIKSIQELLLHLPLD